MKLSVALFFAGLFGALAAVFVLLSFGTDYWLLASETCDPDPNPEGSIGPGGVIIEVSYYMELQENFNNTSEMGVVISVTPAL